MANANTLAKYSNDMRRFEHQINKLIEDIDRFHRSKRADEDVMSKHYVGATEEGERVWSF